LIGVVGVFGVFTGDFFGDGFAAVVVFAVEIGTGFETALLVDGFSTCFTGAFVVPFVCPCDGPDAFLSSPFAGFATSFFRLDVSSFLFASIVGVIVGVSTAASGIVSSITELFFLAPTSAASDCFLSAVSFGCSSSSILKLVLRFDKLGSPLVSLFSPN
jgi:hypothetical protein